MRPSDLQGAHLAITGTQLYLGALLSLPPPPPWEGLLTIAGVHT